MGLEDSSKSHPPAAVARSERRTPRYEFVATIEVKDAVTAARLSGRLAEISLYGCYVDIMNSLPVGAPVMVRISRGQSAFEAEGKIIYVIPNLGMGIAFIDPPPDQLPVLQAWLAELASL